ncbi:MAG TPA: hypothetical protein VMT10_09490 [Solirubrobacteraceae bacterium]|nr:hypothetical protein [Solirubrobacteraceae bacterium]
MSARRFGAALCAAAAPALCLTACETTQDTSARLAKEGSHSLSQAKGLSVSRVNPDISVAGSAVLQDQNGVAAVVRLHNRGAAQADVPVLIAVTGAKGRQLYANTVPGLDPSLVSVAAVPGGTDEYWVNDQVTAAAKVRAVSAKVGVAKQRPPASLPAMRITKLAFGSDVSGVYARGVITNTSRLPQRRLVISCVSLSGSKVVAAGRAIVDRLAPAPTPKPVTFRVYFIGNPKQGKLTCSAPPTTLTPGA